MNLTLSLTTMRLLSDGIILLDPKGQPREANTAAQPWLRRCVELTPQWMLRVEQMQADTLQLPVTVDIDAVGDVMPSATVHLLKNGHNGYALLIQPSTVATPGQGERKKSAFLSLLGGEVRREIAGFVTLLHELHDPIPQTTYLAHQAERLDTLLTQVNALAELDQNDEVFADQRLEIAKIVGAALPTLPRADGDTPIRYTLTESLETLAPVYGNQGWLRKAIYTLLTRLGQSCGEHGSVAIDLRQIGDFVILNARAAADSAGWYDLPASMTESNAAPEHCLRDEICHRVIELHGGQLKIRFTNSDAAASEADEHEVMESFTLTLPTGLPMGERSRVSCAECRITLQAMQYARDLAEMMPGRDAVSHSTNQARSTSHDKNFARR